MVAPVPQRLDDTLLLAAEHRAGGASWKHTAEELGLDEADLRQRAHDDEPRWKKLLRDAEKGVLRATGCEALLIIRKLMRHKDPKIQRDCSIAFVKAWRTTLSSSPPNSARAGRAGNRPVPRGARWRRR